ncbi:MAG: GNAT family N-acetyltransferase [Actinomycetota bacterium]
MEVRRAVRDDLAEIARVADAAYWDTYSGLLKPDTIARVLARDYSPPSLRRRLLRGGVLVAAAGERLIGFADVAHGEALIRLTAISTEPAHRRVGVGAALVGEVRRSAPGLPLCADVLLGNLDGERFYEALGFAPGEVINGTWFGEDVVERRWWLVAS